MSEVFVIRNQLGQFWGKKKLWVDGRRRRKVAIFKHQDEGLNQLVELSARDIELRGDVVAVEKNDSGLPLVEPSKHLIPDEEDLANASDGTEAVDENAAGEDAADEDTAHPDAAGDAVAGEAGDNRAEP